MKREILDYLIANWETIRNMVSDCRCYDGSLEEYEYFENDEWFFKEWFSGDVWKAIELICNGDYKTLDDYVQFDYDCINSYSELEVKENLINNVEEIFDRWYEMFCDNEVEYDYYDIEFKEMIDKYNEEQDE